MEEIKEVMLYFENCEVMKVPMENISYLEVGDSISQFEEHELKLEINKIDGIITQFGDNPIDVINSHGILGIAIIYENGQNEYYNILYSDGDGLKNIFQYNTIHSFNHVAIEISYEVYEHKLLHEKNKLEEKLKKINKKLLDFQNRNNYN